MSHFDNWDFAMNEQYAGSSQNGQRDASMRESLSRAHLRKLDDLQVALETAFRVNVHLNSEVEKFVKELDRLEKERDTWKQHARQLATLLAKERKGGKELPTEDEVDAIFNHPEAAAAPLSNSFVWPTENPMLLKLLEKGRAAGWLIKQEEIVLGSLLGQGAFGTTYKGTWRGGEVAIKCVRIETDTEMTNFLREVECLAAVRHPNILPFLGAVLHDPATCWVVCEFMEGGTLGRWLHGGSGKATGSNRAFIERMQMALEVAQGLQALEEAAPVIMHRDVKPSNIFIDGAGHARVGDFGLARRLLPESAATLTGETGTYLYMSPEMIRHEVYDQKTDVWSWGIMFCELVTGRLPYEHTYMTPVQIALAVADEKLRPWLPPDLHPDLYALAVACCDPDPLIRPTFGHIVLVMQHALPAIRNQLDLQSQSIFSKLLGSSSSSLPQSWGSVLGRVYSSTVGS